MNDLHPWLCRQVEQDRRAVAALTSQPLDNAFETRHRPVLQMILDAPEPSEAAREVLARCEAYERVLARHRHPDPDRAMSPTSCAGCGTVGDLEWEVTDDLNECPELRDMAIAFRHRDGYREGWRP